MKKIALTSLMLLSLLVVKSQIQVSSSGHIGFGTSASTSYNLVSGGSNYFTDYIGIGDTPDSNYKLKVNGNSYLSGYLGIGTTPSSTYRLNLSGDSYFSGTTRLVGNTYLSGGNGYISGNLNITGSTDGPSLDVYSTSIHTPSARFRSVDGFYGPYVVQIYNTPSCNYALGIEGDAYATGYWNRSDIQLKKNISVLNSVEMLVKIKSIDGKKYEFKSSKEIKEIANQSKSGIEKNDFETRLPEGIRYGFIAQEVESVFPELVKTDSITKLKAIDYDGMIPVLLSCIKEQQNKIEALEASVNELTSTPKQNAQKRIITSSKTTETDLGNTLYQNAPNPFSQSTVIEYYVKESVKDARICIYNMNGSQLKSIKITENEAGSITINSRDLKAGMYLYSLIADGNLVDTKRMVLTD